MIYVCDILWIYDLVAEPLEKYARQLGIVRHDGMGWDESQLG